MTLSEAEFLRIRLEAMEKVETEIDLLNWDDDTVSSPEYLPLSQASIRKLEDAYDDKLAWIYGIGGG